MDLRRKCGRDVEDRAIQTMQLIPDPEQQAFVLIGAGADLLATAMARVLVANPHMTLAQATEALIDTLAHSLRMKLSEPSMELTIEDLRKSTRK